MEKNLLLLYIFWFLTPPLYSFSASDMHVIAEKIWKNECGATVNGLTCWNKGENFGSFGIGHFIWYPEGEEMIFEETFPELLTFIQKEGFSLPSWLKKTKKCPWSSREIFYKNIDSQKMVELRHFLFDTKELQAKFIAKRLESVLPILIEDLEGKEEKHVQTLFSKLSKDPYGVYAMTDYLNFKGAGVSSNETYQGKGWGLLQVLQKIPHNSQNVLEHFVEAAKEVLKTRVDNSPPERNEARWLKGWLNRVDTYRKNQ